MRKNSTTWRRAFAAVFAVLVLVFGLAACGGGSDEDAIKNMLNKEFSSVTNASEADVKEYFGDSISELEQYGVDPMELWKALYSKFSYEIGEVTVEGDAGHADVTVQNIDISTGIQNWYSKLTEFASSEEGLKVYQDEGEEGLMKQVMNLLIEELNSEELATVNNTVHVDVKKENGSWTFADRDNVLSALFGGVDPSSLL